MSVMLRFAGSEGSTAKKIRPLTFSYAPAVPKPAPVATSARDCTSMRTTSADAGAAASASTIATRIIRSMQSSPGNSIPNSKFQIPNSKLLSERVGTQLKAHHLAGRSLAGFHVERRSRADGRVQAAPLPSRFRVVDAAVHPFRVEADRVRDAQHHPLPVFQREQPFGCVARVDWRVLAEAERIMPVHPRVIARFRAAW